jgi:hypothetical protein
MRPLVLAAALVLAPLTAAQAGQEPGSRAADGQLSGKQVFGSPEPAVAGAVHVKGVEARGVVIRSVESRTVEPKAGEAKPIQVKTNEAAKAVGQGARTEPAGTPARAPVQAPAATGSSPAATGSSPAAKMQAPSARTDAPAAPAGTIEATGGTKASAPAKTN